jgi:DNA ligase-1
MFIFNKLITGGFRVELSHYDLVPAIVQHTGIEKYSIARRLTENWHPQTISFEELFVKDDKDYSKPYPFTLARHIEFNPEELGDPSGWHAGWKWDGIRAQLVKRNGELFIWSRRDELLTHKFPELAGSYHCLPDGIAVDGEVVCYYNGKTLPFQVLQARICRKNLTSKIINDAPVKFMAYDLIEYEFIDIREHPLVERRSKLEKIFANIPPGSPFELQPPVKFNDWQELSAARMGARENLAESLLLRRKNSHYTSVSESCDWWKWKAEPYTFNGVLIYAQRPKASTPVPYSEFAFAVWDNDKLVTAAKANSGLTESEINEVDDFIKQNTLERFGPVRTLRPRLVFEIAFDGIAGSNRHKSGFALRTPRILRWRKDLKIYQADTINDMRQLIK